MAELITYAYKALDASGKMVKNTVDASSQNVAVSKIRAMKLQLVDIAEADSSGMNMQINLPFKKKVKLKDVAIMTRQLASMIEAGMPMIRSLAAVAEQTKNKLLNSALRQVMQDIESGSSLSAALGKHPEIFPKIMVGMIKVGESGGFLETSLKSLAENLEDDVALRGKIKAAMAYPIAVGAMAVVGVSIMLLFVVPIFSEMFKSMGADLPLPTQLMVNASHAAPWSMPLSVILVILFMSIWPKFKDKEGVRKVIDPVKLKFPVIGKVYHKIIISRFAKNISTMLSAGVPLMQALTIVGETSGNIVLEKAIQDIADEVRGGKSIAKPMQKNAIFPVMLVQMIAVGEESGNIEKMFENVAAFYDQEVKATTDQLTSLIEPLLIIGIGLLIGGMVISLYLPMFSLYSVLNDKASPAK